MGIYSGAEFFQAGESFAGGGFVDQLTDTADLFIVATGAVGVGVAARWVIQALFAFADATDAEVFPEKSIAALAAFKE